MIDAGKAYNAANRQFVNGIRELAQQSTTDEVIEVNENAASRRTNPPQLCWFAGAVQDVVLRSSSAAGASTLTLNLPHEAPLQPHISHIL